MRTSERGIERRDVSIASYNSETSLRERLRTDFRRCGPRVLRLICPIPVLVLPQPMLRPIAMIVTGLEFHSRCASWVHVVRLHVPSNVHDARPVLSGQMSLSNLQCAAWCIIHVLPSTSPMLLVPLLSKYFNCDCRQRNEQQRLLEGVFPVLGGLIYAVIAKSLIQAGT